MVISHKIVVDPAHLVFDRLKKRGLSFGRRIMYHLFNRVLRKTDVTSPCHFDELLHALFVPHFGFLVKEPLQLFAPHFFVGTCLQELSVLDGSKEPFKLKITGALRNYLVRN